MIRVKEEKLKLYIVQYAILECVVDFDISIASNERDALKEVVENWSKKYESPFIKPRVLSIRETIHPDYNISLERKLN